MHLLLEAHLKNGEARHAYVIVGDMKAGAENAKSAAAAILGGDSLESNPDCFFVARGSFGIEESRLMREWVYQKPFGEKGKVFIVQAETFTKEAMNAILKITEEPPAATYFFIVVPSINLIIPTLLSRLTAVEIRRKPEDFGEDGLGLADKFLKNSIGGRLEFIVDLFSDKNKESDGALSFLDALEVAVFSRGREKLRHEDEIQKVKRFFKNRGASQKMLAEYLALVLPKM